MKQEPMKAAEAHRKHCPKCRPLINGWCDYAQAGNGLMLDEKCPRVRGFVNHVMGVRTWTRE